MFPRRQMGQGQANNILTQGFFQTSRLYSKDSFQLGGGTKVRGDRKQARDGWVV